MNANDWQDNDYDSEVIYTCPTCESTLDQSSYVCPNDYCGMTIHQIIDHLRAQLAEAKRLNIFLKKQIKKLKEK